MYDNFTQQMFSERFLYPPHDEATWEDMWRIIASMNGLSPVRLGRQHGIPMECLADERRHGRHDQRAAMNAEMGLIPIEQLAIRYFAEPAFTQELVRRKKQNTKHGHLFWSTR